MMKSSHLSVCPAHVLYHFKSEAGFFLDHNSPLEQ